MLDDSASQFPLAGHLESFFDETGLLTQEQIASPEYAQHFRPERGFFNGGFKREGAWWVRFELRAAQGAGDDWWLHLGAPYVDQLDVWLPVRTEEGVALRHRALGGERPLSARDLPWTVPVLQLTAVPEDGPHFVWIRMAGERSIGLLGFVWKLDAMTGYMQGVAYRIAAVIGMLLLMAAVSLMLGAALPDARFLWYAAYLAVTGVLVACSENVVATMLMPEHPLAALRIQHIAVPLGVVTFAMFAHSLLDLRSQFPRIALAFRLVAMFSLLAMVVSAAGYYVLFAPLGNLIRVVLTLVIIVLCVALLRRGQPGAWPNLIGFAVYGAVAVMFFAKNLDWLPYTRLTQYSYVIGLAVHMLAIFLGLGLRVRLRERQALADSRAAGARLEASVAERTRELHAEVQERERTQAQLRVAMQEQRNFLSLVSHELRAPLAVIGASAEIISDDRLTASRDDDAQREISKIDRARSRMLGLVDNLLTNEWLSSSEAQIQRCEFDLLDMLVDRAHDHTHASGREIRFESPLDALRISADERLLFIVFDNLIDNAVKYSPAGKSVDVSARCEDGDIVVEVRDHGAGFNEAELHRVFERFYRAGKARREPGVGLGLYMVRRIIELHGGSVRAANAPGGGALLTVVLPLAEPVAKNPRAESSASGPAPCKKTQELQEKGVAAARFARKIW